MSREDVEWLWLKSALTTRRQNRVPEKPETAFRLSICEQRALQLPHRHIRLYLSIQSAPSRTREKPLTSIRVPAAMVDLKGGGRASSAVSFLVVQLTQTNARRDLCYLNDTAVDAQNGKKKTHDGHYEAAFGSPPARFVLPVAPPSLRIPNALPHTDTDDTQTSSSSTCCTRGSLFELENDRCGCQNGLGAQAPDRCRRKEQHQRGRQQNGRGGVQRDQVVWQASVR